MINALANICGENKLLSKILIVPSYTIGQNIIGKLLAATPVFNLKVETVQGIAVGLGMPLLADNNLTFADDNITRQLMFEIIYNMRQNNKFEYFTDMQATPSISDSIWKAVMELKFAGLYCDSLDENSFVCTEKGRDIKKIIYEYDCLLKKQGLTDLPGLIQEVIANSKKEDVLLIVPNSLKLRLLEKKLIAAKFTSIQILYDEPVNGINVPDSYYCANYPDNLASKSPFANLYSADLINKDTDLSHIHLMKAYGESNEVEAVLRDIKAKKIPFDSVCIYTVSREPYAQLLYQKAEQLGVPVTFGYGVSIRNSRPGKAFDAITRWIASNYQVSELIKLLYQELIQVPLEDGSTINPYQAANALRASGIGWGRERYLAMLDDQISKMQNESNMDNDYKLNRLNLLTSVRQFIEKMFNLIPHSPDGIISLKELAQGISAVINSFSQVKIQLDAEAKTAITERLNTISTELYIDVDEALRILNSNINNIRIGVSGHKQGCLHLVNFDNGFFIDRLHHYFIGLDADRFPGNAGEDPILLDVEKQKLSNSIIQNKEKPNESVYKIVELLSSIRGSITLSYSSFDPAENREKMPSAFILQIYRMISRNVSADYSDLKNYFVKTEGYITETSLDENALWLYKYYKSPGATSIKESVFECYPHLKQGGKAWDNQSSNKFTCYDGFIGNIGIKTDGEVFSASKLELLAKCPYQYFLRYVLNISPPDEVVYDPETWLDPLQKGSLYHAVFERFYKIISEKKEKPSKEAYSAVILEIAELVIQEYKKQIPPPNGIVFDIEKREILESCLIFLAGEEENAGNGTPVEFELAFGLGNEGYPPVEITLPSDRKLLLSGIIDRVDKLGENIYRVIDYKSGGAYGFSDRDFFKGGRQIQHTLYAYACELLLGKSKDCENVKVTEGVYLFPTKKGEGRRFTRVQRDISKFLNLIDDLFTIIEEGTFAATEDAGDCRWCDYNVVCRVHRLQTVIADKKSDCTVKALEALRRLATYE